ncbi:MAG TPA: glutathione S-transferase [Stellaceae bacterium]|nr:glutathione S-transferase [Stellaceae bacterium]
MTIIEARVLAMKLYDYTLAPNPRRVRIFLAEKGIAVPTVPVDLRAGEQFTPEFRRINPECTVPVLEFDDGKRIAEVVAICTYFEIVHPAPPLMGAGAEDQAIVTAWQHRVERQGMWAAADAFRNSAPGLQGRALAGPDDYAQIPALAERGRTRVMRFFEMLDGELAGREFIAGERYTIADITALVTVDFAARIKLAIPEDGVHLRRWHREVSARPSAAA